MPAPVNQPVSNRWKNSIALQRSSGYSAAAWCRDNSVIYHQFLYWKRRLERVPATNTSNEAFYELRQPQPDESGIEIVVEGLVVPISKRFDPATLANCLSLIRGLTC